MPQTIRDGRGGGTARVTSASARRRKKRRQARLTFFLYVAVSLTLALGVYMVMRGGRAADPVVLAVPTATPTPAPGEATPEPTPAPTPSPTPEPTPSPTPHLVTSEYDFEYSVLDGVPQTNRALGIQEGEPVDDSYFDDAVFVGDSVSLKLYQYVKKHRQTDASFLGKAQFLTAGSLGSGNALVSLKANNSVHPTYMGTKMLIEDAVPRMKARKVYIMLGMNDIALYGIEGSVENMMTLCGRIQKNAPKAAIYIQSATPIIEGKEGQKLTNANLFRYNLQLYAACAERGYHFVDVAYVMRDSRGYLPDEYCSDPEGQGIHFNDRACGIWIEYLRTHTQID